MSEGDEHFLSRWSRRKREALRTPVETPAPAAAASAAPAPVVPVSTVAADAPLAEPSEAAHPRPLPPLESLTAESDFTPFMQAKVDPGVRSQALKTLFQDPQFNVMDGLDVYIDDYSKPDPLPEGWLAKMSQMARLGAYVEPDPAPEDEAGQAAADPTEAPPAEPVALPAAQTPPDEVASPTVAVQETAPGSPSTSDPVRGNTDHS